MTVTQELQLKSLLTEAHNTYYEGLHSYAFFKVNNSNTSEDLVQHAFMKTWIYLVKGGKVETIKAFLYHILNNLIIDEYRKHKVSSLDVLVEKGFEPPASSDQDRLVNVLDGRAALPMIEHLPLMYRKVVGMRYLQDLSLEEISKVTGLSKNTISVQIHRGLEKLKNLWEQKTTPT